MQGKLSLTDAGQQLAGKYQDVLNGMPVADQQAIADYLSGTGQFKYDKKDAWSDAAIDLQLETRMGGLGQSVFGALSAWASSVLCPVTAWGLR